MLRFTFFLLIIAAVSLVASPYLAADEVKTDEAKDNKSEETQTKPAKVYDLKPKFTKDMEWKEEATLKYKRYYNYSGYTTNSQDEVSLKSKVKITEFKDAKATKVKFYEVNGSGSVETTTTDGSEYSQNYEVTEGVIECDIDKDGLMEIKKNENIEWDILMVYPGEMFEWFDCPDRAKKVGDTWDSEKLPVYRKAIETDSGKFQDVKGQFKFDRVKEDGDIEIGYIKWTGTCVLTKYMYSGPYDVKWEAEVKIDLTNKRVLGFKCEASVTLEEGNKGGMVLNILRKASYDKVQKKEEKNKPVAPKNEDDE